MLRHRTTGNVAWSRAEERGPEGGAQAQEDRLQSPSKLSRAVLDGETNDALVLE